MQSGGAALFSTKIKDFLLKHLIFIHLLSKMLSRLDLPLRNFNKDFQKYVFECMKSTLQACLFYGRTHNRILSLTSNSHPDEL